MVELPDVQVNVKKSHAEHDSGIVIPESYYNAYMCPGCVAEFALAKGGIRLANTLNLIFGQ